MFSTIEQRQLRRAAGELLKRHDPHQCAGGSGDLRDDLAPYLPVRLAERLFAMPEETVAVEIARATGLRATCVAFDGDVQWTIESAAARANRSRRSA